jgi:hypothetical protein
MRPDIEAFLARVKRHAVGVLRVQLVPEMDPETLGFDLKTPDRLLAGAVSYERCKAKGMLDAPPISWAERIRLAREVSDELHTGGRCTCGGGGECAWCKRTCIHCGGAASAIHQCPPEPGLEFAPEPDAGVAALMARIAKPFPAPDQVNGYPLAEAPARHGMTESCPFGRENCGRACTCWQQRGDPLSDLRAALDPVNAELLCGPPVYVFSPGLLRDYRDELLEQGNARLAGEIQAVLDDPKARL